MSIIGSIVEGGTRAARMVETEKRAYPPHWLARLFGDAGYQNAAGITVSGENAWKYAAFYGAIDLISRGVGALPWHLYRRVGEDEREKARNHPLYELIHTRPNPEQTAFIWRQTMQAWCLTWGNAYSEIERNGLDRATALWPLPSNKTKPKRDDDGELVYEVRNPDPVIIPARNVLHIRTLGDGLVGKSPVRLHAEAIGLGMAAQKAGAAFFGNGMRPSGALEHPGHLSEEAFAHLRQQKKEEHGGAENTGKLLILEEGMQYNQMAIPPEDAQYIATMVHQVRDIARIFHVPPHKLADLADATFSNVEEQNLEWVADCLRPWLVNWEQEAEYKLLRPSERPGYYTAFNIKGLLRGNSEARAQFYRELWNIGALTINDIRALEDMNPIEGGDTAYVPLNMVPLSEAENLATMPPDTGGNDDGDAERTRKPLTRLLEDACGRIVRGEVGAIEKAQKRGELPECADDAFGPDHTNWCRDVLVTPLWAAMAVHGRSVDRTDALEAAGDLARRHTREVRAMAGEGGFDEELERWGSAEPPRWAAEIIANMENEHATAETEG